MFSAKAASLDQIRATNKVPEAEDMHVFEAGARRSEIKPRYDLIPSLALERLARRYALGASKYGEHNWQKGLPLSDTYNHAIEHLLKAKEIMLSGELFPGETPDDDLAAAMWGLCTLMWYQERAK
jgi:hypothetical protein